MKVGVAASGRQSAIQLVRRGAGTPATTNTVWSTVTNAVDGTPPANPATYAVYTSNVSGAVGTMEVSGYDFSTIPGGATIVNAQATIRHLCSLAAGWTSATIQAFDGATTIGSALTLTLATSARNDTLTFTPTVAQVKSATFKIRFTTTHAANTTSRSFSIDHIDVSVSYAP